MTQALSAGHEETDVLPALVQAVSDVRHSDQIVGFNLEDLKVCTFRIRPRGR